MDYLPEISDDEVELQEGSIANIIVSDSDENTKDELNDIISDSEEELSKNKNNVLKSPQIEAVTMNIKVQKSKTKNRISDTDSDEEDYTKTSKPKLPQSSSKKNKSTKNSVSKQLGDSFTKMRNVSSIPPGNSDSEDESLKIVRVRKYVFDSPVKNKSVRKTKKKPLFESDDSDNDESVEVTPKKNNAIISDSEEEEDDDVHDATTTVFANIPTQLEQSTTPKHKNEKSARVTSKKNNVIISDSEEEDDDVHDDTTTVFANIPTQLEQSTTPKHKNEKSARVTSKKKNSDSESEVDMHHDLITDVDNMSAQLENSRISQNFKNKMFLSSTVIEPTTLSSTPVNRETGKRLLNKSVETPRLFKQIKDSNTPSLEKRKVVGEAVHTPNVFRSPDAFRNPASATRREVTQSILVSSSSDEQDDDIIDVSDDDAIFQNTNKTFKQPTLPDLIRKKSQSEETTSTQRSPESEFIEVSSSQYEEQQDKVRRLELDLQKASSLAKTINLDHLPDKGASLKNRQRALEQKQMEEVRKLSRMKITLKNTNPLAAVQTHPSILPWNELEAGAVRVQPNAFGKKALSVYNAQKALTIDRLQQLHGSLETCPKETDLAEPPRGLKVELMQHQLRALSWLTWRENQKPSGGILADDMGLGKTLTMISLMLKCNESEKGEDSDDEDENDVDKRKYKGGTLVVCPASLINQWSGELTRRTTRGLASCELYHGAKRETKPKRLAKHDMVVTTYSIVMNECEKNGAVFGVKWRRIIIDEAHQIRNHKSQTSDAVCRLSAKSRWALTGTPVHNKELDMYALLKFLRCSPFDDLSVWKRWVGDKSTGGTERLHTVISSLMLRRTKPELIEKGLLNTMPDRKWELIPIELAKGERDVYSKILIFSRTLFSQFLHQRAEKNQDAADYNLGDNQPNGPNQEYFLMRQKLLKLNKLRDIKQHEILVLLLRLRQICNHPSLITGMLHEDMEVLGDDDAEGDKADALDLLEQLNRLDIEDRGPSTSGAAEVYSDEAPTLREVVKNVLSPSDPVFSKTRMSSKIKAVIKLLSERIMPRSEKAIIVSQWPSFLELIAYHLKAEQIKHDQLDGKVPVHKRMEMVDRFNNPKDSMRILLLSLTAGGVGLNLVGANHLILLDLHWNPQLENQAQDRIYRVGQEKPVFVYKFMATDTIEKRILDLQEKKLDMANAMLTGTVQASRNKLTLQDLRMLFEM